jgi:hypothetical protein
VEALLHFAGNFWWLIFPLSGVIGGGLKAVQAANERRAQRRLERYRIKQQTKVALAEASGRARTNEAANRREMTKVLARHDNACAASTAAGVGRRRHQRGAQGRLRARQ